MIASRHRNHTSKSVSQTMSRLPWAPATILSLILAGCGTFSLFPPARLGTTIEQAEIPSLKGVIVTAVGETAQEVGLEKNDIIVRLADQPITNLSDLRAAMNVLSGGVEVEVYRPKVGVPEEPVSFLEPFLRPFLGQQNPGTTPSGSWHVIAFTLPGSIQAPDNPQTPGTDATDQSDEPSEDAIDADQFEPLGSLQTMTPQLAELVGYANWRGVRVTRVLANSNAEVGGLLVGDIIIGFRPSSKDEEKVESIARFERMISDHADKEVMFRYVRGQVPHTVTLTLRPYEPPDVSSGPDLGLAVMDDSSVPGVRIDGVFPDGLAAQAGLLRGDFITAVGFQPVDSKEQFLEKIRERMDQDMVQLEVHREGLTQYVWLQLPPSG